MAVINTATTQTLTTTSKEDFGGAEKFEFELIAGGVGGFGVVANSGYLWANWKAHYLQRDLSNEPDFPSWISVSRTGAGYGSWTISEEGSFNDIKITEAGTYRITGELAFRNPDVGTNAYDFDPFIAWYFTDSTDENINFGGTDDPDAYWDGFYSLSIGDIPTASVQTLHNARFDNIFTVSPELGGSITFKIASIYNGDPLTNNSYLASENGSTPRSEFKITKLSNTVDPTFGNYILR